MQIPESLVHPGALGRFLQTIAALVARGGGSVAMVDLLSIIGFPDDVEKRIRESRGVVSVACGAGGCVVKNAGKRVNEDIPDTNGTLGLIVHEVFSCRLTISARPIEVVLDNIRGLDANVPGPLNPDIDKIVVRPPNFIDIQMF